MAHERMSRPGIREIASPGNALLKVFRRALADGVTREGWLAVEGPRLVEEALDAGKSSTKGKVTVQSVLVARGVVQKFRPLLERLPQDAEVAEVPDRLFDQVAETETPQGIAALVELVELAPHDLDAAIARPDALILVACGLQDPGNLGTMMRSAQALGGSALITLPATVSPFNPKAVRSSAGSVFRLPVFRGVEPVALVERAKSAGVELIAADRHASLPVTETDFRGPVAFLIGQEAAGLPEELARHATLRVRIPIRADTDSLNAATAASILLYEAARQRGFKS
ncbi:MAG TPA: RNA methyltransferase [Terriglobia bacterium]|nr:RNA methyltransferase [Terriglobia bacterium]